MLKYKGFKISLSILFLITVVPNFNLFSQNSNFKIVTQDVKNFWNAYDALDVNSDTTEIFQKYVIDNASDDFKIFIKKWKITSSNYKDQLKKFPKFYSSLRTYTNELLKSEDSIRRIIYKFEQLYPNFKSANVCIGFGNFATGGNISIDSKNHVIYIGLEYHGVNENTFIKELPESTKDYVSRSNFYRTIVHELVHVQQRTSGKKIANSYNDGLLINRLLSEGVADFVAQTIVKEGNNGNYYKYGIENEKILKSQLFPMIYEPNYGFWFGGNDSMFNNKPRDLGYFMGSRIAQSYMLTNQIPITKLSEIIEIKNLKNFVNASHYFD
jgi:hypothetical protein